MKQLVICFLLATIISLSTFSPVLLYGTKGTFYSLDPDIMYVGNAISYAKDRQLHYFDHPGVLSIVLLSNSFIPLRLYAKYVAKTNFISWSFENYDIVFYYSRIFECLLLIIGLTFLFCSVYVLTKRYSLIIISALLLYLFPPFYNLSHIISSETTSFLLSTLTIFFSSLFINNKKIFYYWIAILISGLAVGNRITAISIVFVPLLSLICFYNNNIKNIFMIFIKGVGVFILSLYISVWPLRDRWLVIVKHLFKLSSGTEIHGGGKQVFFEMEAYLRHFETLFISNPYILIVVLSTAILAYIIFRRTKNKMNLFMFSLSSLTLITFMVFAKFPLLHYELINYLILSTILTILLKDINTKSYILVCLILIGLFKPIYTNHLNILNSKINETNNINLFLDKNLHGGKKIITWSNSKEYATIWTNNWAGKIFEEELTRKGLFELNSWNLTECGAQFLVSNKEDIPTSNIKTLIPATNLYFVTSPKCINIY